jgi:hypothetical protein
MYANSPVTYPYPAVLFRLGRDLNATMGYAHFQGSMPHSTQLMDLTLGTIDFIEVMQFGVLKTEPWYELLNAGIKVTGIAGSDFPVGLNRAKVWPRYIPLLGPERTLVRKKDEGGYSAWAAGVRDGSAMVTNGPLVDLAFQQGGVAVTARFFRPIERLEFIANGKVVASGKGNSLTAPIPDDTFWVAARAVARKEEGEPEIQAHTNPVYRGNVPWESVRAVRDELAKKWEAEIEYYKTAPLVFPSDAERQKFFQDADRALAGLRNPP